jgi:hypothetical protein
MLVGWKGKSFGANREGSFGNFKNQSGFLNYCFWVGKVDLYFSLFKDRIRNF